MLHLLRRISRTRQLKQMYIGIQAAEVGITCIARPSLIGPGVVKLYPLLPAFYPDPCTNQSVHLAKSDTCVTNSSL